MTGSDVCPSALQLPFFQVGRATVNSYVYAFPWESVTDTGDRSGRVGLSVTLDMTAECAL